MSNNFCVLPWVHMHIWPNGLTYPCCLATNDYSLGNTNTQSLKELWNSERMRELRKNIIVDKPTAGCSRCYTHESNGARSMRQAMNAEFEHHFDRTKLTNTDGSLDEIHMAYMDIRFSNICNMRCRTCGPDLSSNWVDDAIKLGRYSPDAPKVLKIKPTLEEFWADMSPWIDTVESIYFAGGEPLIMDEHYRILEHLIEIGKTDILICYNTNFSKLVYKDKDIIKIWQNFKHVNVGASLDASGKRAEFMRKGTVWKNIEKNIKRLHLEAPHVQFRVNSTVSAYNVWHCADFFEELVSKGYVQPQNIDINILLFPEIQRLQILPTAIKYEAAVKIEQFIEKYNLQDADKNGGSYASFTALLNTLTQDNSKDVDMFKEQNKLMDTIRNENMYEVFPELKVLLDE